jgi:Sulfotransferase domain
MDTIDNPIFVRGMSRSGGTLLVTLLDAHRDIAMSYELYPNLLEAGGALDLAALAKGLQSRWQTLRLESLIPEKNVRTFFARCERGGISLGESGALLQRLISEGLGFATDRGRFRFVELLGLEKMRKAGKSRWGMKCSNDLDAYLNSWKSCCFLNVLRDGRDVLASQLNTGDFKNSPADVARGWMNTHTRFEHYVATPGVNARMVRYEHLVTEPEPELRGIFEFLGLPFDPATLKHQDQDLTVFKASHLSKKRVQQSVDATKVGRWRRDLSPQQLEEFMAAAGPAMTHFGYTP